MLSSLQHEALFRIGTPSRAMYSIGGALGYTYFYPLNIRLKLNMI